MRGLLGRRAGESNRPRQRHCLATPFCSSQHKYACMCARTSKTTHALGTLTRVHSPTTLTYNIPMLCAANWQPWTATCRQRNVHVTCTQDVHLHVNATGQRGQACCGSIRSITANLEVAVGMHAYCNVTKYAATECVHCSGTYTY